MKIYNCDVCGELIYFENSLCLNCNSELGYIPVLDIMSSLELQQNNVYKSLAPSAGGALYKKCSNYIYENICNWMLPVEDPDEQCLSCRLNLHLPDLSVFENRIYWHRLEIAKRRLIYTLIRLRLPIRSKTIDPESGLGFAFLRDDIRVNRKETQKILTGHSHGLITINLAEANDAIREKTRLNMNERYRTLLGHFRHEIGHYYWTLLIENNKDNIEEFRTIFGDETINYNKSLKQYYKEGPPLNWQYSYVSAYATSHPWEDWAESWAHFMHMDESLETARSWGLKVSYNIDENSNPVDMNIGSLTFEQMRHQWVYLSIALNSLNRSMGLPDVYPFVLSESVFEKMKFIQKVILSNSNPESQQRE